MVGSPDLDANLRRPEYKVGILTGHDVGWNKVIGTNRHVICPLAFCNRVHAREWHRTFWNDDSFTNLNCIFLRPVVLYKYYCVFQSYATVCCTNIFSPYGCAACIACVLVRERYLPESVILIPSKHVKIIHEVYCVWVMHIAHEIAVCRNPHNLSNWDSRITRQLGYKQTNKQTNERTNRSKCCVHKKMLN
jgi:hypothetical protein